SKGLVILALFLCTYTVNKNKLYYIIFLGGFIMVKIRRMFPGGNTSHGFYHLHDNIIGLDRNKLYILKGMPGGGKSSLMKEIGKRALEEGFTLEYHHCPSDPR